MLSGRRLDLLDPSPLDIEIEDIAHGLARVARWNGQTFGANIFSVAQHSLLVEEVGARRRAAARPAARASQILLHDAPEYVIGDMISPFKAVIGDAYKAVEKRLLTAIHRRFGLPPELPPNDRPDQGGRPRRRVSSKRRSSPASRPPRRAASSAARAGLAAAVERDYLAWPAETAQARYLDQFKKLAGE